MDVYIDLMAPNSTPPRLVNSQLVSLPPVGILNLLCLICIVFVCNVHLIIRTWNLRDINVHYLFNYLFIKDTFTVDLNFSVVPYNIFIFTITINKVS